jgi:hypothetical protein
MRLLASTCTLSVLLCLPTTSAAQWSVEVLGPFEGRPTAAAALNDHGVVVGNGWNAEGEVPILWTRQEGYRTFLGNVAGRALDINNRGEIVGVLFSPEWRGFLWSEARGLVDLGTFEPLRINESGEIAGRCPDPIFDPVFSDPLPGPCLWSDGTVTPILVLFSGVATAINDVGNVAGYTADPDATEERELAFVWRQEGGPQLLQVPSGAFNSWASGMNNRGVVVGGGWVPDMGAHRAMVWDLATGHLRQGPEINGTAIAVNDAGIVAGASPAVRMEDGRGFVWTPERGVVFLPGEDASLPTDINQRGDVVGNVFTATGSYAGLWRYRARGLHITTPNTPSRWGLNTTHRLAWTYNGDAPQFLIEISRDSGKTWDSLTTVANGAGDSQNFDWMVTGPLASAAKFRVSAIGDPEATDVNDANIRIANATIEILSPTKTTSVAIGSELLVHYRHSLGARTPIEIEVSGNNGRTWRPIAHTTTNGSVTGSFWWNVDVPPTSAARVRVRALDRSGAAAMSRAFGVSGAIEPHFSTDAPPIPSQRQRL